MAFNDTARITSRTVDISPCPVGKELQVAVIKRAQLTTRYPTRYILGKNVQNVPGCAKISEQLLTVTKFAVAHAAF